MKKNAWKNLPTRSRKKCREMIFALKRKKVWIVRCPKRATWQYGGLSYGHRCDEHKKFIENMVVEGVKAVTKLLRSR